MSLLTPMITYFCVSLSLIYIVAVYTITPPIYIATDRIIYSISSITKVLPQFYQSHTGLSVRSKTYVSP